jgi:enamine deaminase RidA (YjgF/YER057c/UK114 family)
MRVGDLLFVSGQAAISLEGELVGIGDFNAQAEQTFRNLERVLEAGGLGPRPGREGDDSFSPTWRTFPRSWSCAAAGSTPPYPADTIVEVSSLALPGLEIEIEAIAVAS